MHLCHSTILFNYTVETTLFDYCFHCSSLDLDPSEQDVVHPCNVDCNCTTASYDPVCGHDGVEYFTPCHGGCQVEFIYEGENVSLLVLSNIRLC